MTTRALQAPPAPALARRGQENLDRITRVFALFVGVGYVGYLVLLLPPIIALSSRMAAWWTPAAVIMAFGPGVLLGVVSRFGDIALTKWMAGTAALSYFFAVATWPFAWSGTHIADSEAVWFAAFPGLAALAAVLAWRPWIALLHMLLGVVCAQVINYVARTSMEPVMLIPEILFSIMYCLIFVGGVLMALRTGRLLDESTEELHAKAASAGAREARTVERERFDALIHDSVLSTLLTASRRGAHDDVPGLAAATLAELDGIEARSEVDQPLEPVRALVHLRGLAADADSSVAFEVTADPADDGVLAAEVVQTVGAAMAEAIRNCARHAGARARCTVRGVVGASALCVEVIDDGVGFDPRGVDASRLGITISIRGRMSRLPGGTASIDSAPGAGTTVRLEWRRP